MCTLQDTIQSGKKNSKKRKTEIEKHSWPVFVIFLFIIADKARASGNAYIGVSVLCERLRAKGGGGER